MDKKLEDSLKPKNQCIGRIDFRKWLDMRLVGVLGFAIVLPVLYFGIVFRKVERSF